MLWVQLNDQKRNLITISLIPDFHKISIRFYHYQIPTKYNDYLSNLNSQ